MHGSRCWFTILTLVGLVVCARVERGVAQDWPELAAQPSVGAAARAIDELVGKALAQQNRTPLPITSDAQFVRRIYLDAIGRIPTLAEARKFVECTEPDKRGQLIDRLLKSRGYVSHNYNFWADVLRIKDEDSAISRAFYVNWVKDSLANNKPYDQFVRELVTAAGSGWQRGNGAVGYYLRDRGMPLDNMANTLRIFVGTRLACAQCHDHPHDRWTRREFFEMAAYTSNLVTDNRDALFSAIYGREKTTTDEDLRAFSQYIRNTYHADKVLGKSDGTIKLPDDYQYDDAKGGEKIAARPLFGPTGLSAGDDSADRRQLFGQWLTSPENPRFTLVIANRLWERAMGRGLIEPVDDMRDDTQASNPELLEYLVQLMKDLKYDMRGYLRVLYNTDTYQRCTDPDESADDEPPSFRGRQLVRMTAEQAWDSLMTLVVADIDSRESGFYDSAIYYGNKPVLVGKEDMHSRFEEVKDHSADQHWAYLPGQLQAMKDDLEAQKRAGTIAADDVGRGFYRRPRSEGVLVRASELRSPAEPSHFLRTFGQSNRELIEGSNMASNVTQFMSMFNGPVESYLLKNSQSELMKCLSHEASFSGKCDVAYMSILSRLPTDDERQTIASIPATDDARRINDLVWALVNSQEFIFVQ